MLTLVTGTPGSGKTLYTIHSLKEEKERSVYYHGIPDLADTLGWIPLEDPFTFDQQVPDGSIVIIDECQKTFPVRAPRDKVPESLSNMETHRHRGLDVYFITQHPMLIDHHFRRLTGRHLHIRRNFGAPFAAVYEANELFDINDRAQTERTQKTTFKYPKKTFDLYKSAEIHTHKFRMPKKLLALPLAIFLVIGCIYLLTSTLFGESEAHASSSTSDTPATNSLKNSIYKPQGVANAQTMADQLTPAIQDIPTSAPIYYEKWQSSIRSIPRVAGCLETKTRCLCYTQQATRLTLSKEACTSYRTFGYFDHTKPDVRLSDKPNRPSPVVIGALLKPRLQIPE